MNIKSNNNYSKQNKNKLNIIVFSVIFILLAGIIFIVSFASAYSDPGDDRAAEIAEDFVQEVITGEYIDNEAINNFKPTRYEQNGEIDSPSFLSSVMRPYRVEYFLYNDLIEEAVLISVEVQPSFPDIFKEWEPEVQYLEDFGIFAISESGCKAQRLSDDINNDERKEISKNYRDCLRLEKAFNEGFGS